MAETTELLYFDDTFRFECEAAVRWVEPHGDSVDGAPPRYAIALDKTVAYPAGGGQPDDGTDPVAVVALLNELGASAGLTMAITGESLLNDGTAMVLFSLFFSRVAESGGPEGFFGIVGFFLQMAVGGPLLGLEFLNPSHE